MKTGTYGIMALFASHRLMLAFDVLEVPMSCQGNRYLLVLQDYFTKWAKSILMPDQTGERIVHVFG